MCADDVKRSKQHREKTNCQLIVLRSQLAYANDERLDLLQSLHVMHPGNLAHAVDDVFEMFQVSNIENDIDVSLPIRTAYLHIPNVGFGIADHGCHLFQHAEAVVTEDRELYRVRTRGSLVAGPFHIDAALRFIQQVHHVGAIHRVDGDAFAAGHVTDHVFAANRIAAAGAVHEQIAVALYADGIVAAVSAENSPDYARDAARLTLSDRRRGSRGQTSQHLPRRIFAVSYSRHQVVDLAQAVVGSDLTQLFVLDFFQRDPVFPRFFLNQLAPDFDGAFTLMDVEPVLDLVAGARGLDDAQPVAAGRAPWLGDNLHNVAAVELVTQRHHASIHFGAYATVADFGVNGIGKIDGCRFARQHYHFPLRGKRVNLFGIQVDLEGGKELSWVGHIALPLDHLPQPRQPLLVLGRDWAILVLPVSCDAFFRHAVHFLSSDLHFERRAILGDHRGMQRLIKIWPRHGNEVFDSSGHGPPYVMHNSQHAVAILQ